MKVIIVQMNSLTSEIPTARYFRYFLVSIQYFSVSVIPTSVSVFKNTVVSVQYRYYRPRPTFYTPHFTHNDLQHNKNLPLQQHVHDDVLPQPRAIGIARGGPGGPRPPKGSGKKFVRPF